MGRRGQWKGCYSWHRPHRINSTWILYCRNAHRWGSWPIVGKKRPRPWCYSWKRPHRVTRMSILSRNDIVSLVCVSHVRVLPCVGHNVNWWVNWTRVRGRKPYPWCFHPAVSPYKREYNISIYYIMATYHVCVALLCI